MKLVAENITITHRTIKEALAARDPEPLRAVARLASVCGAALDINLGPARRGIEEDLDFALDALKGHHRGGLWLDGSDASLMARAAERWPGPLTLNGYSGNPGREGIVSLAAERGFDLVVFLMTDKGIPPTLDGRLELAAALVGRAQASGVPLERIVIDPVVAPLGWTQGQELNARLLETLRELPRLFGAPVSSVIGLSNLLTRSTGGARPPEWLEDAFLAAASGAGLTHAMVDITRPRLPQLATALTAFAGETPFAPGEYTP